LRDPIANLRFNIERPDIGKFTGATGKVSMRLDITA